MGFQFIRQTPITREKGKPLMEVTIKATRKEFEELAIQVTDKRTPQAGRSVDYLLMLLQATRMPVALCVRPPFTNMRDLVLLNSKVHLLVSDE
jgi:hypothetical protein